MSFRYSINISDIGLPEVGKILLWCHLNLNYERDFSYTDECVYIGYGNEARKPESIYFNSLLDVTALSLATGVKL